MPFQLNSEKLHSILESIQINSCNHFNSEYHSKFLTHMIKMADEGVNIAHEDVNHMQQEVEIETDNENSFVVGNSFVS